MLNAEQTRAQKKPLEVVKEEKNYSVEQLDDELNENIPDDEKEKEALLVVKEFSVQDLIKNPPKVFLQEQHNSTFSSDLGCENLAELEAERSIRTKSYSLSPDNVKC
ncbi:hypothetical protein NPIL_81481 [Nephila pilipes]|uniref:Uncharacterized protein n=1 Tax=Nephila pilipes TaxID=299642 RepID=A0A8X6N3M1_NEPPI|nr:hypothetical protein NPIL_81481 [Nephila pilipes]